MNPARNLPRVQSRRGGVMSELVVALGILGIILPGITVMFGAGLTLSNRALRETDQQLITSQVQHWLADPAHLGGRQKSVILLFDDACHLLPDKAAQPAWKAELRLVPSPGWESPRLQCLHVRFLSADSGRELGSTLLQRAITPA
ncbi:MAG: hypothetical protein JWL81_1819 [Verrucomicrobiales bacterium]|nr:hypothetical protein [Verrucomicrobiales bacterium]